MFKAIVMEIKEKYVIVMKDGGEILRINKKSDLKIGETIFCLDEDIYNGRVGSKNKGLKNLLIPLGVVAALILIFINPIFNRFSSNLNNTYAVLTFDVNPSIEFNLDANGKIINVKGLNDDGKVLDINTITGLTVEEGAIKLKEILTKDNYLGNGNSILVGFSFLGNDNIEYEENVQNIVKTTFNDTNVAFVKGNEQSLAMAAEQGISLGKYEAIAKLDEDGIEEAFENLSTQELLDLLKSNNSNLFLNEDALDELQDELEDRLEDEQEDDNSHDDDHNDNDNNSDDDHNDNTEDNDDNNDEDND